MRLCLGFLLGLTVIAVQAAGVKREVDPRTGIERVEMTHPGFYLRLVPLTRDYVVAAFLGRGLPKAVAEATRGYCTFGATLRNTGDEPVRVRLTDWRFVTPDGRVHRPKTKSQWIREWAEQGVPFKWLLVHEGHSFQPGDWMQGFITVPLPPGARFDLHYRWIQGGQAHEGVIEDMRCAPERIEAE